MRLLILLSLCLFVLINCVAQPTPNQALNLSFEKTDEKGQVIGCSMPWDKDDYFSFKDDSIKVDGKNSVRLQKDTASAKGGYGVITFSLPANFKGSEVTLNGFIRTEGVQGGFAGLWLRTDAGKESVGFENMADKGITGTTEWKQYSITVPMNDDVTDILFGGLLAGKGRCWFDKLELLIDNKPVESVTWIPGKIKPELKELTASIVRIDSLLSKQQVENLYVLGRIWGYLKYHHPEVARRNYNYDSCLFAIMPAILKASNMAERDNYLLSWINSLGDENKYPIATSLDEKDLYSKPELSWLNDKSLFSEKISAKLNNIYLHRNSGSNYYIRMMQGVGNPYFNREATYANVPASDDGFRMLGLFRFWNIIEYFFPYKHLFKESWPGVLKEFIPDFASNRSSLNYRLASLRLINRVHDTHASIYSDTILTNYFGKNAPGIDFKILDSKVIVDDYLNDAPASAGLLKAGDEIIEVNGKKIENVRKSVESYLCASNSSVANRNFLSRFLFRSNDDSMTVKYKRNNKIATVVIRLYPVNLTYKNGDNWQMPMYKLLSENIGYISLGKIEADSLPAIFKKFEKTRGIIIDIRNYPKEFMPFAMAEYIKASASPFVKFTAGDLNNPGSFRWTPALSNGPTGSKTGYKGAVIILVNENSQSQAEYTTMALRTAPRAVVMGSQTAGADGNVSFVSFPGGFSTMFSGIGVFYPDGKETQGIGIVPDVVVMPTQKGITEGKDEVLEKAKEYIQKMKGF
jgi:hypothetical protein